MRIVCVIDDLGSGGAQRQLVNLALGLTARGHQTSFFTYHRDAHFRPLLAEANIPVHCAAKAHRYSPRPVLALRRFVVAQRAEAVIAFLETPAVYAELACLATGVRLLVGERNSVVGDEVTFGRSIKSSLHRLADVVVANSESHRLWMARHFPYLRSRLCAVWNGIDLDTFAASPTLPRTATLRLLGIGRVAPAKNVPRLIEALARVRANGVDARVDWVGRVDIADEKRRADAALASAGLGDAWRWLGERHDVAAQLASHDALIAPSLTEGLPNAVCEALASGRPVLASAIADNARLVGEPERGYTFPPTDVDAMANTIARFATLEDAARRRMGRGARKFAEHELSLAANVDSYERLLTEGARLR